MRLPTLFFTVLFICISEFYSYGQYDNEIYFSNKEIVSSDSSSLFFHFRSSAFINNKEFFNPYQPGYTLLGFFTRPLIVYNAGANTTLSAGAHLLKYSGLGKYHQVIPVFTFHHRFFKGFDMVIGSIYGAADHNLIEPLFTFDRLFTHHNESGLQVLIDNRILKADIWLNWERFIFTGDPFQEEFTAGLSSKLFPGYGTGPLRFEIPVQLIAVHKGGQIDTSEDRLQTLLNYSSGLHLELDIDNSFLRMLSFRGYLAGYRDMSNIVHYHYEKGWGVYPNLIFHTRWVDWGFGYWAGHKFVAPRGEPVFQSVSQVDSELTRDNRKLFTSKVMFNHHLARGINMGLRFEFYHDFSSGQLDHSGGLHIMIDDRFFISTLKRR